MIMMFYKQKIKQVFKYFFELFLVLLIYGCNKNASNIVMLSDIPPLNISEKFEGLIEIKNWLAIGPFEFDPKKTSEMESFFTEDLAKYGIKEGLINDSGIIKIQKRGVRTFLIKNNSLKLKLFNYVLNRAERKSNFYLVTQFTSSINQDATFILDGSNCYSVWLNGHKLIEERGRYNTNKAGDRFINVSLKEGMNTVFVKINRSTNKLSWDFICTIAPLEEAKRIFRINYIGDFVVNPIINDSIEIYSGPYSSGKVELFDGKNQVIVNSFFDFQNTKEQSFAISELKELDEGFYKVILTVNGGEIEEIVYKGNYKEFVEHIQDSIKVIKGGGFYTDDLSVAMLRVNYVNNMRDNFVSSNEKRYQNRNRVFWGYSLRRIINKNASTQFMTYKDEDHDQGVFIFHTNDRQQQRRPLVIIVPFVLGGESMIEDWYSSNLHQIEANTALADQYGFSLAWIYAQGKNYSAEKTKKEINAVIKRLHSDCGIDTNRVFLLGSCEGGRRALVQLALSPGRYAGCVVSTPITLSGRINEIPIQLLPQIGNVPILIMHGRNDNVTPIEESRRFYFEALKHNMPVDYIENDDSHDSIYRDYFRFAFEFFNLIAY